MIESIIPVFILIGIGLYIYLKDDDSKKPITRNSLENLEVYYKLN